MLVGIGLNLSSNGLDAPFDLGEVIKKLFEQHPHGGGQIVLGCRVAFKSGTRRVGQRLLPLNVTFRRQLVGVFPCFAVRSGQLRQEGGAPFQTHEAKQLLRSHRGQC